MIDQNELMAKTFLNRVEVFEELTSTQDVGRELAFSDPVELPALVLAEHQTAGRGQRGHSWWTGKGSLAATLVWAPAVGVENGPLASLLIALAVAQAAEAVLGGRGVQISWPNDVYVGEKKLAGILVEVTAAGVVLAGIGVNTNNTLSDAPAEVRAIATSLRDVRDRPVDQTALLIDVLRRVESLLNTAILDSGRVSALVNERFQQRERMVTVETPGGELYGRCEGVDRQGALLIVSGGRTEKVYSGRVKIEERST